MGFTCPYFFGWLIGTRASEDCPCVSEGTHLTGFYKTTLVDTSEMTSSKVFYSEKKMLIYNLNSLKNVHDGLIKK